MTEEHVFSSGTCAHFFSGEHDFSNFVPEDFLKFMLMLIHEKCENNKTFSKNANSLNTGTSLKSNSKRCACLGRSSVAAQTGAPRPVQDRKDSQASGSVDTLAPPLDTKAFPGIGDVACRCTRQEMSRDIW